jgi:hypothetical protein
MITFYDELWAFGLLFGRLTSFDMCRIIGNVRALSVTGYIVGLRS